MKKIIIIIIVFFIIYGGRGYSYNSSVKSGYGYSTNKNVKIAVREAVKKLKKNVKKPDFVLLFSTANYDSEKLLNGIHKLLGSKIKIYGGTSSQGVMTTAGYHSSKEKRALAILGVSSSKIKFGVGAASIDKVKSPIIAGKRAVLRAIRNAGKKRIQKPSIIFITSAPGKEEMILKGIKKVVGSDVPVFGGSSADNDISGKWKQFANNKVFSNAVVLGVLYTDLKIGFQYENGFLRTQLQSTVTKANKRIIYEINHQPAAEVYNRWLNGALNDVMKTGGNILTRTTTHPLAKVVTGKNGGIYYISIHPLAINMPEGSLTVFANVKTGDKISLLYGDWQLLMNRAYTIPIKALTRGGIAKNGIGFAIYTFCAGTLLAIPGNERWKMPKLMKNVLGDIPFIGTFTFGEQGYLPGVGNVHANLVSSIVIIGE